MADEVKVRSIGDSDYIKPFECKTHCDDIPSPWHEELEKNLNSAGGHVQYGIGKEEDEFCSKEDVIAWVEARRDDDALTAFPQEEDCTSEESPEDFKFTIKQWLEVKQEDSPWETTYHAESDEKDGHEVWKDKYAKVYGRPVTDEIEKAWPDAIGQDAAKHEKIQAEYAAAEKGEETEEEE